MQKVILAFKNHVHESMEDYRQKAHPISDRRNNDIWQIDQILEKDHTRLDDCIDEINMYLKTIKTGWWFIQTGNSMLKDNVNFVIKEYKDPLLKSLILKSNSSDMTGIWEALKEAKTLQKLDENQNCEELLDTRLLKINIKISAHKEKVSMNCWSSKPTMFPAEQTLQTAISPKQALNPAPVQYRVQGRTLVKC